MKRLFLLAVLFAVPSSTATAGDFWFSTPRGFTYGQSTPNYTWTTGPQGYSFFYSGVPQYQQPTNYVGGFGNYYNVQQNYGTVYASQYNRYYWSR